MYFGSTKVRAVEMSLSLRSRAPGDRDVVVVAPAYRSCVQERLAIEMLLASPRQMMLRSRAPGDRNVVVVAAFGSAGRLRCWLYLGE